MVSNLKTCLEGPNVEILLSIFLHEQETFLQKWLIPGPGKECSRLDWNILVCWKANMCSKGGQVERTPELA